MSETTNSDATIHGSQASAASHGATYGAAAHVDAGHDRGHGEALGPFDWRAWGAGLLGVAAGLAVAACFWLSANL